MSGFFKNAETGKRSYGIIYFALIFLILAYSFGEDQPHLVYYPLIVLALADGVATIIGYYKGNRVFSFSTERKTVEGSLAFLSITIAVWWISPNLPFLTYPQLPVSQILFISLFLTIVELLSSKSQDNIWIPSAAVYWIMLDFTLLNPLFIILIPILAFLAFWKKSLTADGSLAASILGWILFLTPEPIIIVFPATFFLVGSLLSKLPGHKDETSNRNAIQVFANGLVPTICFMLYFVGDNDVFLIAGVSGIAFALSDTSSSEIGVRMGGKHFYVWNRNGASKGSSGGVTVLGSLAGVLFAFLLGLLAFGLIDSFGWLELGIISTAGILGNISDTLIGGLYQARFQNTEGAIVEKNSGSLIHGYRWIDNSTTNLLSSIFSCLLGLIFSVVI